MNIFLLHLDPEKCAQMHVDKHVVKMILETAQMLCTVHHVTKTKWKHTYTPPYKETHKNHPCNVWLRESTDNYVWLVTLGLELCKEYTYRYGKIHKCQSYIEELGLNIPPLPEIGLTPHKQAMPEYYKSDNSQESYRAYYFFEKHELFNWRKRNRIINTVQGFTDDDENLAIRISSREQVKTVIYNHMNKVIQENGDEDVLEEMSSGGDKFLTFVKKEVAGRVDGWHKEYGNEFVEHLMSVINEYTHTMTYE